MQTIERPPMTQAMAIAPTSRGLLPHLDEQDPNALGRIFHTSGFFADTKSEAQAIVKVLYGRELGVPPVTAMLSIHVIQGKPAPSAGLLASLIKRSGRYTYRVRDQGDTRVDLEFFEKWNGAWESAGHSVFTLEDGKRAGALEGPNKATWQKFPRNMLFARALSNGARWFCADIFGGPVYVPEELGAAIDAEGAVLEGPVATGAALVCADCQQPIVDVRTASGLVTATEVAQRSRANPALGRELCFRCAKAAALQPAVVEAPLQTTREVLEEDLPPEQRTITRPSGAVVDVASGEVLHEAPRTGKPPKGTKVRTCALCGSITDCLPLEDETGAWRCADTLLCEVRLNETQPAPAEPAGLPL